VIAGKKGSPLADRGAGRSAAYWSERPTEETGDDSRFRMLPWSEHRRTVRWDEGHGEGVGDTWGHELGAHPWIDLDCERRGRMVEIPPANGAPLPPLGDRVLFGATGRVECTVADAIYTLDPLDALVVPADVDCAVFNVDEGLSSFLDFVPAAR
jgi:hypothetical protein